MWCFWTKDNEVGLVRNRDSCVRTFKIKGNISWTKLERLVLSYYTDQSKRLVSETAQFEIS